VELGSDVIGGKVGCVTGGRVDVTEVVEVTVVTGGGLADPASRSKISSGKASAMA